MFRIQRVATTVVKVNAGCSHLLPRNPKKFLLSLVLSAALSLLPAGAPLADVISSLWKGGPGSWSTSEKWDPQGIPSNSGNYYLVTIPGASSVTLNDLNPAVDSLTLQSGAKLSIIGKSLEIQDNSGGILSNSGTIEFKGTSLEPASNLRIYGEVLYDGNNGVIIYDNNINHGIEGTTAPSQKLIIGTTATMLLQGAGTGGGSRLPGSGVGYAFAAGKLW